MKKHGLYIFFLFMYYTFIRREGNRQIYRNQTSKRMFYVQFSDGCTLLCFFFFILFFQY